MNTMKLVDKILDGRNIFNSIYCMESYVFDKGLLDEEDLRLYYALADKHNMDLIDGVIAACRERLQWLFKDKDNLFVAKVYFKLKKYDPHEQKLSFRPMHTAKLIDLICMVSIMNCLMFDDDLDAGKRNLSDLSKLLPHNFYGNIPSTDVQYLFHRWQTKYKEYTEAVVEHCRAYQKNHSYLTEICLDIKNFFPSISPKMLYDYIISKLSRRYEDDNEALSMAVSKLLYFKIQKENVEPWKDYYYPEGTDLTGVEEYMNCGIPQGLPQSYFFGNLCMIEVKNLLMKEGLFKGDAYFYVDDSVIYIKSKLSDDEFKEKIVNLNNELKAWCERNEATPSDIDNYVGAVCLAFQKKLTYIIKFHEEGKSVFTHIDDADNQYGPIANITRETSMHSKLAYNLDEIDDHVSMKKLQALDDVISKEIKELNEKQKDGEGKGQNGDAIASRLKLLKRFKKFFLYRNRLLKIREDGGPNEEKESFIERFQLNTGNAEEFFELFDEDIFQSEYRLLIQKLSKKEAEAFQTQIRDFEKQLIEGCNIETDGKTDWMFYAKDVNAAYRMKTLSQDIYASLVRWSKENFSGLRSVKLEKEMETFRAFLEQGVGDKKCPSIYDMQETGFEDREYTMFVMKASAEYKRRILNVFFSEILNVVPSDALAFTKMNARRFKYAELRIMAYLRNRNFDLEEFEEFIEHLDEKDISNQMGIDMGVLEVLNIFIRNVRKPKWVDEMIMTHRLIKGLWYNGSKFLNSYTLHNEEHAVTLITKSQELTNRIDYFVLKDVDYYILFLACYLHDISMVIHPELGRLSSENGKNLALISERMKQMRDETDRFWKYDENVKKDSRYKDAGKFLVTVFNEVFSYFETLVRDNHANESAKFIRDHSNSFLGYLEPTLLSFVATVSESHGYDVLEVYGVKSKAKDDTVSLKYLMILIRLADLLDVANDRVNYHLLRQNLKNLSPASKFHWISHLVTDKIELNTDYITDGDAKMGEKPITEIINLELYLNVKQLTVAKQHRKCRRCQLEKGLGGNDCLGIRIAEGGDPSVTCSEDECTVLCYWMMQKHDWLIKELTALNDYLYSVNNSLFKTKINFLIHYRDEMRLDADMFDSVQEYLNT